MELRSHPSRGGWIEIVNGKTGDVTLTGPTPRGVGGLKSGVAVSALGETLSPTPRGVGGLKFS